MKSNAEQAIDAVIDWVPTMLDTLVESVTKEGGWPGIVELTGAKLTRVYEQAPVLKQPGDGKVLTKGELWARMSPDEREAIKALYPQEQPNVYS